MLMHFFHRLCHVLSVSVTAHTEYTGSHDTQVYTHAYWETWHTQQCWHTHVVITLKYTISHMHTQLKWISVAWLCGRLSWKGVFYKHNVCRLAGVNDPIASELPQRLCACTCVFLAEAKRHCSTVLSPSLPNETCPRHHYKSSIYAIRELGSSG